MKPKPVQLLEILKWACKTLGKQPPPLKDTKLDQVLQGIADGQYRVVTPPDEESEELDAGVYSRPIARSMDGMRKLADLSLAQDGKEPPCPGEVMIVDDKDQNALVGVAPKPPKQQRRGSENDPALLSHLKEIKEERSRTERRLTRLEDSSASKDAIKMLVKNGGWSAG